MGKWWTRIASKELRVSWTRDFLINKTGVKGAHLKCIYTGKSLQDSIMWKDFIPFLGNWNGWMPLCSAHTVMGNKQEELGVCDLIQGQRCAGIVNMTGVLQ